MLLAGPRRTFFPVYDVGAYAHHRHHCYRDPPTSRPWAGPRARVVDGPIPSVRGARRGGAPPQPGRRKSRPRDFARWCAAGERMQVYVSGCFSIALFHPFLLFGSRTHMEEGFLKSTEQCGSLSLPTFFSPMRPGQRVPGSEAFCYPEILRPRQPAASGAIHACIATFTREAQTLPSPAFSKTGHWRHTPNLGKTGQERPGHPQRPTSTSTTVSSQPVSTCTYLLPTPPCPGLF